MSGQNPIVDLIGKELFYWLSSQFGEETQMAEVPEEILERLAVINVATRNFGADRNAVTAIALLTFAYNLAGRQQSAHLGPRDMLLLKVLAKEELGRRRGQAPSLRIPEGLPLSEVITGEVGDRIRALPSINSPFKGRA